MQLSWYSDYYYNGNVHFLLDFVLLLLLLMFVVLGSLRELYFALRRGILDLMIFRLH